MTLHRGVDMADATDIVREMVNAWNAHDPDGVARYVSNDFVSESDTLAGSRSRPGCGATRSADVCACVLRSALRGRAERVEWRLRDHTRDVSRTPRWTDNRPSA